MILRSVRTNSSLFAVLVVLMICSFDSGAQTIYTIKGQIIDGENGKGLSFATVFLDRTIIGGRSDTDGKFELVNIPSGKYKLVISFVGFESLTVDVLAQEEKVYKIVLKPSVKVLREISVTAKGRSRSHWRENYELFVRNFIGMSENARLCKIKNPGVLKFNFEDDTLEAFADSILVVENMGLGYEIHLLLEEFKYNKRERKVLYKGKFYFNPMKPRDENLAKRWAYSRVKAYNGSEMHFMRSLFKKEAIEEGFMMNIFRDVNVYGTIVNKAIADKKLTVKSRLFKQPMKILTLVNYKQILDSVRSTSAYCILNFTGILDVVYINEAASLNFRRARDPEKTYGPIPQRSRLKLLQPGVSIDENGVVFPEEHLETVGYWSWELVSESLPSDYDPENDMKSTVYSKKP